ncbi:MAG: ABC transporter substrate-binding protein [Kiritimatiellia bacterium]
MSRILTRARLGVAFAALMWLGIIIGCRRDSPDSLRVVMNLSEEEWAVMRGQVLPAFEARTGIRIQAFQVGSAQLVSQLEALVGAGRSEIDVFAQDNMSLAALVNRDLVYDVSAYADRIPDAVHPNLIDAGRFDGRLLFMPFRPNVQIAYYNTAAFARYDLDPPRTWESLLAVARRFYEEEQTGRFVFKGYGSAPTATQIYEFVLQAGGDPLVFDDAGCVAAFRFLQELGAYFSPESSRAKWDTMNEILARQEGYLGQNWPFGVSVLIQQYGLDFVDTYEGWAGPAGRAHVIGGDVLGIARNSARKDEGLALIAFLQSKDVQELLVRELGWPAVRDDAYGEVAAWQQPHFAAVQDALAHGVFRQNVAWWPAYQQMVVQAYQDIVGRGAEVEATLALYKEKLEREKGRFE